MSCKRSLVVSIVLATDCASQLRAATPDLNGPIWRPVRVQGELRTLDGKRPPLLPAALLKYEQNVADRRAGKLDFDQTERCNAPGVPRLLLQNMPFEFLQRDERIFIHYQWNRLMRSVDMNVAQPEPYSPLLLGQSVGKWQGNTLVIDSISFNDTTLLDDSGLPHSESLHVVESYTLGKDGKTLTLRMNIEDPLTFSQPWQAERQYRRDDNGRIDEDVCVERKGVVFWKESET